MLEISSIQYQFMEPEYQVLVLDYISMENLDARKQALIAEITAAFDGVAREGGVSLREATVIDDYGSDEERAEARAQDTEARWQDVPNEDISRGDAVLSFLDPIGFRYYIPAYIVWFLRYADDADSEFSGSNTYDSITHHLGVRHTHPSPPGDYELARYKILTREQSKAIAHFLVFLAEREETWKIEDAGRRKRAVADGRESQAEYDAYLERVKEARIIFQTTENGAQYALDHWWGQFL